MNRTTPYLDASRDYAGGGTRFYPKEASAPSFVVRPARGAAVAFDGTVEHEGEAVVGGRRHVVVVFATEVDEIALNLVAGRQCSSQQKRRASAVRH